MKRRFSAVKILAAVGGAFIALLVASCNERSTENLEAVKLDAARYVGKWYEIARLPRWFEKDVKNATAEYVLQDDGTFKVVNRGMRDGKATTAEAVGKVVKPGTGELEVSFFRPFYGAYRVIILDEEYTLAAVTSSTFSSLWILSRTKEPDEKLLAEYVKKLKNMGFDTDALEYPQTAAERAVTSAEVSD